MKERIKTGAIVLLSVALLVTYCTGQSLYKEYKENKVLVDEERALLHTEIDNLDSTVQNLNMRVAELEQEKNDLNLRLEMSQEECGLLEDELDTLQRVELPIYSYTREEVDLLARCVQAEAGEGNIESIKCMTALILNRVRSGSFPNTITDVIYEYGQFDVVSLGMINTTASDSTVRAVYSVLMFGYELPNYVVYFYSSSFSNSWTRSLSTYTEIQGTIFAY